MDREEYIKMVKNVVYSKKLSKKYKSLLDNILGEHTFWTFVPVWQEKIDKNFIKKYLRTEIECNICKEKKRNYLKCVKSISSDRLKKTIEYNKIMHFECYGGKKGVYIPILFKEDVCGIVVICGISKKLSEETFRLFKVIGRLLSDLITEETELKKLRDTLQPRAVALSTIHTVHRIIGSTLELKELLPKMARLCIQIVRANRCTISLVDAKQKYLVPFVTIDLRDPEAKSRRMEIGKGRVGKVAQDTQIYKNDNCISLPLVNEDVIGVLTVRDKQGGSKFDTYDVEILSVFSEQSSVAIRNAELYEEQKKMIVESVNSLSALLSVQIPSPYLCDIGFVEIVVAIGIRSGLNQSELNALRYASILRNVAKVGIPGEILLKSEELTKSEYELIKQHSREMVELIRPLEVLKPAIPVLVHHRENYNGSGYPSGLKGEEIPLGARIMSIVEAFEAMIAERPYKKAKTISEAVKEINKNRGSQFDPTIVDIFLDLVNEGVIEEIVNSRRD